jgi:hypothetical protein
VSLGQNIVGIKKGCHFNFNEREKDRKCHATGPIIIKVAGNTKSTSDLYNLIRFRGFALN